MCILHRNKSAMVSKNEDLKSKIKKNLGEYFHLINKHRKRKLKFYIS